MQVLILSYLKSTDKAQHSVDKSVHDEHKRASALNEAQHQHEAAIASQQNAEKTLNVSHCFSFSS